MSENDHLYDLIAKYERFKDDFNRVPVYGIDDFERGRNEGERQRISAAMKRLEAEIRKITHKEHPTLVSPDIDILISNVKIHVDAPQGPEQAWEFDPAR